MTVPIPLYIYACTTGAGSHLLAEAYHMLFPAQVMNASPPPCHLEALNIVAALQTLAPMHQGQLIRLYTDSAMAATISSIRKGQGQIHSCMCMASVVDLC